MFRDFVRIASCVPATKSGTPLENSRAAADMIDVITSAEEHVDFILFPLNTLCGANVGSLSRNGSFADLNSRAETALINFIKEKNTAPVVMFFNESLCKRCGNIHLRSFIVSSRTTHTLNLCGCTDSDGYADSIVCENKRFKFCVLPITDIERDLTLYHEQIMSCEFVFLSCAFPEQTAMFDKTLNLVKATSKLAGNVIVLANASTTNTTTPYLYIGATAAVHNGTLLDTARQNNFDEIITINDIDYKTVNLKNNRPNFDCRHKIEIDVVRESIKKNEDFSKKLYCDFSKDPFFERDLTQEQINHRLDGVINAEKFVIAGRVRALTENKSNCSKIVIAVSGGLDSAAALIYAYEAVKLLGLSVKDNIIAVTMRGFGTSKKTRVNAFDLIESVGAGLIDVPIEKSIKQHFSDIGHDENVRDIVYENAQARERMQIALDLANKHGGFVLNTGDLSEAALGFCTFGGDHLGQLAVNSCITKTMLQKVVKRYADVTENRDLAEILLKIVDTTISPELLPPDENGDIAQSTEDFIGPYILHDFFLYYHLKYNFPVEKIYFYAVRAFADMFTTEEIKKYLKVFVRRFYTNQFKRICSPESSLISSINLSPLSCIFPSDLNPDEIIGLVDKI